MEAKITTNFSGVEMTVVKFGLESVIKYGISDDKPRKAENDATKERINSN